MRIWIDPVKLSSYGVTVSDVRTALEKQNVELPSGKLTGANTELMVKTLGNLSTEKEFNDIIILSNENKTVRLSDIGNASLESENLETKFTESGNPMVAVAIVPQPGSNYLEIADQFYTQFDKLKKNYQKILRLILL